MRAIYKCRLCGEKKYNLNVPDDWCIPIITDLAVCGEQISYTQTGKVTLVSTHACTGGGLGLADFQGFTKEDSDVLEE